MAWTHTPFSHVPPPPLNPSRTPCSSILGMCLREQPACLGGSNFQQPAQNFILQSNEAMPWGVAGSGHTGDTIYEDLVLLWGIDCSLALSLSHWAYWAVSSSIVKFLELPKNFRSQSSNLMAKCDMRWRNGTPTLCYLMLLPQIFAMLPMSSLMA